MNPKNARSDRETPASFVDRVTAGLRAHAQAKRDAVPVGIGYSDLPTVAGNVDTLASWTAGLDTGDPRLYALMVAHTVLRDPDDVTRWLPGPEQRRTLSRIGMGGAFEVDYSLTELASAATEDVVTVLHTRASAAEAERDRLRVEVEELADIKAHVDAAKARLGITHTVREVDMASLARAARLGALEAALAANPATSPETPAEPEPAAEMPQGVRRHGAGFQAYARVDGKQRAKSFDTVELAAAQADAWRQRNEAVAA